MDDLLETNVFETNLLACHPTKIPMILARGQPLPLGSDYIASTSSYMNWVHPFATVDIVYPIGMRCCDEENTMLSVGQKARDVERILKNEYEKKRVGKV